MSSNYYEQLKDPRWQRKRLEVLEREDFTCQWCESTERTLHVHHTSYKKGAAPWDYRSNSLIVLCEECHSKSHETRSRLNAAVDAIMANPISAISADRVRGYLKAVVADGLEDLDVPIPFRNAEEAQGLGDFAHSRGEEVIDAAEGELSGELRISLRLLRQMRYEAACRRWVEVASTAPGAA